MSSFELTLEVPSKVTFRVEGTRLYSAYGQAQASSDLGARKAVQFAEKNHDPRAVPKL